MEKPNGAHSMQVLLKLWALRGGSRIEESEVSEGKWCTTYPSAPEAMNAKIDAFVPEAMLQHFWNEEAEWF
jgi:hypothetical protein